MQRYDQAYFDRWYRDEGFGSPVRLERKVRYAVGAAEYLLDRPVRSVLDIGCGEGAWRAALRRHRPGIRYVGVDPSTYAVERYGRSRGLRLGGMGGLVDLDLDADAPFDLAVCVDVLGYVPAPALRSGLAVLGRLLEGVALVEVFTRGDRWVGDRAGFHDRPAATYDRWFAEAGLTRIGPNLLAGPRLLPALAALERP